MGDKRQAEASLDANDPESVGAELARIVSPGVKALVSACTTLIGSGLLTWLVTLLIEPDVQVFVRDQVALSGGYSAIVDIDNSSSHVIDGLSFVAGSGEASVVSVSSPVVLNDMLGQVRPPGSRRLMVSGIQPRSSVSLVIAYGAERPAEPLLLEVHPSARVRRVSSRIAKGWEDFLAKYWIALAFYALVNGGLVYYVVSYAKKANEVLRARQLELRSAMSANNERLESAKADLAELQDRMFASEKKIRESSLRARILVLSRLSDAHKELEFWRGVIAAIAKKGGVKIDLVQEVRQQMNLRGAGKYVKRYDTVMALAAELEFAEERSKDFGAKSSDGAGVSDSKG